VIELRFHEELYDGFAVDEAVKTYADFLTAELVRERVGYMVRVMALPGALKDGLDEATIAAELANYALGKTIERSRARDTALGGAPADGGGAG
jgi:hypothetical protein